MRGEVGRSGSEGRPGHVQSCDSDLLRSGDHFTHYLAEKGTGKGI